MGDGKLFSFLCYPEIPRAGKPPSPAPGSARRELIADLNSVRNKFRTDPEVLAEWSTASRIHRTGRRRNDDDTPPPEPPVV